MLPEVNPEIEYLRLLLSEHEFAVNFTRLYDGVVDPDRYDDYARLKFGAQYTNALVDVCREALEDAGIDAPNKIRALDIATGTGRNAVALAQAGMEVDAMDLSNDMLSKLQGHRLVRETGQIHPMQADMNQPFPYPNDAFDLVTTMWADRFIYPVERFVSDVHRVLKPNGVFVWPMFGDGVFWHALSGDRTHPTRPFELAKLARDTGFSRVTMREAPLALQRNFPHIVFPTFLIAAK